MFFPDVSRYETLPMRILLKYYLITILTIGLSPLVHSQISCSQTEVDFGEITRQTDRVVDFTFSNTSSSDALILRSGFSDEYEILYSSRSIAAGASETLRVKYNPRQKGGFHEQVSVWFSSMDKPVMLTFKGDVQFVDQSGHIACPDFRSRPIDGGASESFVIEVVDRESQKPIRKGRVRIVEKGRLRSTLITDREGQADFDVPISYYYLIADAEGYMPVDTASYINQRNNYFRFELEPLADNEEVVAITHQAEEVTEKELEVVEEVSIRIDFKKPPEEEPVEEPKPEEVEPLASTDEVLPVAQFRRNNVVFLIDVSQSMSQKGKMELVKAAMLELVEVIRDVDQVAVVTYASNPEVKLKSTSGDKKDDIAGIVEDIQAGGMTAGAKGFKTAYGQVMSNFLKEGNNQLIVVTDGAFKVSDTGKIDKLVDKYRDKGVKTSVLGIKSNIHATRNLTAIAETGHGSFMVIENYDESKEKLIDEIKKQSAIAGK